jgi:hypothetical protein
MNSARCTLLLAVPVVVVGACSLATAHASTTVGFDSDAAEEREARIFTDGRLRVGHLETIRVAGFPGKGIAEVAFFPTAICEDGCGASSYRGGRTNASGAAEFKVRIPGTFFDHRNRHVYLRDGERIDVEVTWRGPDNGFAVGSANPEPILVRNHGANRG